MTGKVACLLFACWLFAFARWVTCMKNGLQPMNSCIFCSPGYSSGNFQSPRHMRPLIQKDEFFSADSVNRPMGLN
jgi:hypothetical protein